MAEQQQPDRLTVVTVLEVYAALRAAWRKFMGAEPERASLLVLLAHWSLETGRGRGMHCFNLGNIKHVPGDGRDFCTFRASEVVGGVERFSVMAFRAYPSLEEGARDYLTELVGTFRYAWPAVLAGAPADFSHRLKVSRYYTADEGLYTRALVALVHGLDAEIGADTLPELPSADATGGLGQVAIEQSADEHPPGGHDDPAPTA